MRRLGTDYFDIYLMHWPDDFGTPIKETMEYVQKLKEQGKVRMLGLCNVDIDYIAQASEYRYRAAAVLDGEPGRPAPAPVVRGA